jgi:hypothetical protein
MVLGVVHIVLGWGVRLILEGELGGGAGDDVLAPTPCQSV